MGDVEDNDEEGGAYKQLMADESVFDLPEIYKTEAEGLGEGAEIGQGYEEMVEDPEKWRMNDLMEDWADEPFHATADDKGADFFVRSGWDPELNFEEEVYDFKTNYSYWPYETDDDNSEDGEDVVVDEEEDAEARKRWGRPKFADEDDDSDNDEERLPYYRPYKKPYPPFYEYDWELGAEEGVIEQLEKMEYYQQWYSYVFPDGTFFEGTVWNDMAQGKGVYATLWDSFRYEGEWHQNMMSGHGVLECDVPEMEPVPDSEEAKDLRARGHILKTDYIPAEERKWLKKDIADVIRTKTPIPYNQREDIREWLYDYGDIPESGHYKYAGQWKHSRMHGCGIYEVNGEMKWGKFYFGDMMDDPVECTAEVSMLHAGLAEVAAAKARMFTNKPDGMVRELRGPFNDPQHPYMYDEDDVWMAPGFINNFYEVPDLWKRYVHDVDQEREMWLNSFYKSPLRIPMPAELEHWWSKDPEFVRMGYANGGDDDQVLLHLPTGNIINWAEDPEGNIRLFVQPSPEIATKPDGTIIPKKYSDNPEDFVKDVKFLPLGFDEFLYEPPEENEESYITETKEEKNKVKEDWNKFVSEKRKRLAEVQEAAELEKGYSEAQKEFDSVLKDIDAQLELKQKLEEMLQEQNAPEEINIETRELETQVSSMTEPTQDKDEITEEENEEVKEEKEEVKEDEDEEKPPSTFDTFDDSKSTPLSNDGFKEEDEANDEESPPSSFGTLAFSDIGHVTKNSSKGGSGASSSPPPPSTLFASLSLVSQGAVSQFRPFLTWLKDMKSNSPRCSSLGSNSDTSTHCTIQKSGNLESSQQQQIDNKLPGCISLKLQDLSRNKNLNSRIFVSQLQQKAQNPYVSSPTAYSSKPKSCSKTYHKHQWMTPKYGSGQRRNHWIGKNNDIFNLAVPVDYVNCQSLS